MNSYIVQSLAVLVLIANINCAPANKNDSEVHFGYDTENGQHRTEDITFQSANNVTKTKESESKPVEYRGGYSFVSADGYEYMVRYKANENGFQPYVTARKILKPSQGPQSNNSSVVA